MDFAKLEHKLPIAMGSFPGVRADNSVYVDKTDYDLYGRAPQLTNVLLY